MKTSICVIDTGVSPHIDLVMPYNRIIAFVDLVNGNMTPYDDNGHGTFVTGVMAGNGLLSGRKIVSAGYDANIVSIKAFNSHGTARASDIIDALLWVYKHIDIYNIKVLLMSFGTSYSITKMDGILEKIYAKGVDIVASSGSHSDIYYPASSSYTISVGAVDSNLNIMANSSNKSDYYSIGKNVIGIGKTGHRLLSGSSVAAPYVASIIYRIKEEIGDIGHADVRTILDRLAIVKDGIKII